MTDECCIFRKNIADFMYVRMRPKIDFYRLVLDALCC